MQALRFLMLLSIMQLRVSLAMCRWCYRVRKCTALVGSWLHLAQLTRQKNVGMLLPRLPCSMTCVRLNGTVKQ